MANPLYLTDQNFNSDNTFNPDTPSGKVEDGQSILCFGGTNNRPIYVENCTVDAGNTRWGGKLSQIFGAQFTDCTFIGGSKRAFDMVRGGKIHFTNCKFLNGGIRPVITSPYKLTEQCDIGIKGGVADVTFENCIFNDIFLGDYTIYDQIDRPKIRRFTFINCKNSSGGPIVVRGRYASGDTFVFKDTKVKSCFWFSFVTSLYWMYNRKFGDTRKPYGWSVILPEELK